MVLVAASILVRVANYEKGKTNKNKRTPPRSSPPPPHPPRLKRDCRPAPSQQLPSSIRKSIIKKCIFFKSNKYTKDTVSAMNHIRATATFHNDVHGCSLNLFSWHFRICHVCYVYMGYFFAVPVVWWLVCLATPRPPR